MKTQVQKSEAYGTNYVSQQMVVSGNIWSVLQTSGKSNYVSIRKLTNNPHMTLGRTFANWDEAVQHYKSTEMKVALLMVENNFPNS